MPSVHSERSADTLVNGTGKAIRATQRATNKALDRMAERVEDSGEPALDRVLTQAESLARRGMDAVLDRSHRVRDGALDLSDRTVGYVRDEPVKSLLFAAAAGAAIAVLASLLSSAIRRDY
jgi:ElaB/YqjD/DUF883 family membrane-anchored ribosome-binding protein